MEYIINILFKYTLKYINIMMNLSREQSSITVENSFFLCKDLNETQTSFITKNSGEKDFKE